MLMSTHPYHVEREETEKACDCYFDLFFIIIKSCYSSNDIAVHCQ
jgi:hypothetical protein